MKNENENNKAQFSWDGKQEFYISPKFAKILAFLLLFVMSGVLIFGFIKTIIAFVLLFVISVLLGFVRFKTN